MDLGVTFGTQNTCGYGSRSPASALVPSLNLAEVCSNASRNDSSLYWGQVLLIELANEK